jgi:small subunit ribosomal protein S16
MLKIRLQRFGRKNNPAFRVVLTDSKNAAKSGRFIEVLGNYDLKANNFVVNKESVLKRIKEGAQTSDTVHNFLVSQGIIEGQKKNVLPKKSKTGKKKDSKVS